MAAVHVQLDDHGLAHAFGGALALGYYAEPRGTIDIDVNVFIPFEEPEAALTALRPLGFVPEQPAASWLPLAGVRLRAEDEPVALDVFLSLTSGYAEVARRVRRFPFPGTGELPFLSAEDLAVFKLSFGRDKDWVDLRRLAAAQPGMDVTYIERQLLELRGPTMYPRLSRLRSLLR